MKKKSGKKIKSEKQSFDCTKLNSNDASQLFGAGINYCPKHDTTDVATCCQAILVDGGTGEWWCPH